MKKVLILALACVCAVAIGCNKGPKKPADLPKLNPTTVTVVYDDGTPVEGATVALMLAQPTGGRTWNLAGQTDAQGKLVLKTDGNWDGAPAGEYQASVTKEISEYEQPTEQGESVKLKSITRYVSTKYNNMRESGLTASITEGENNIEFKVGEKIEEEVKAL